ncbi:Cna B-type domain-containing protein [Streptococcus caballi]|uniref:Cna B-type domain-containing protein n=1 Tax=Streptococcus caballi TaxID=439220 RepID=UPI000368F593|nr:Cna B-type domain-containing protein [Streptococcus caballi]
MKRLLEKLAALVKQQIKDNVWARIGLVLSIVVVFCTTYVLVLPALTLTSSSSSSVIQESSPSSIITESSTSTTESSASPSASVSQDPSSKEVSTPDSSTEDVTQAGSQTADADNVTVKVDYEAGTFSEKVTLKVTPITDNQSLANKIQDVLNDSKQSLLSSYSYDISFVNEAGAEVEPSKEVKVSMNFKNAVESSNLQEGWKLYHFKDNDVNQVEDLTSDKTTEIKQDGAENVTQVDFQTASFSPYTIAGVAYEDFKPYIVSGSFQGTTTETLHSDGSRTLQTEFKLDYDIPKTELNKTKSYAIELPQDTTWTNVNENQEYTGKDGARDAYKYRFVQENGKKYIVISFLDSYLANAGDKVYGDLKYTATIGETYRKETGNYEIPFTDKVTITVPSDKIEKKEEPQQAQYDVSSNKWGNVTYDGDNAYLNYTVEVYSNKGSKDVVNLTDTLKVDGFKIESFEKSSVIRTDSNGITADLTNSTNLNYSNGKFTTQLPKLSANQKYRITYRYKISGFPAGKSTNIGNGLDLTTPDIPNQHKDNQLEVYRNKISKSGSYDKDTNKIKWTITVNENKNDIAGAELKDTMIAQASDVKITPSKGAIRTSTGYRFTATDGTRNTNVYTITYTTDAGEKPNEWGEAAKTVTNTATITDNGENSSTSDTVTGGKGDTGGLDKSFEKMEATADSNIKTLTWKSTIKMPGSGKIPAGAEFEDILRGQDNTNNGEHYFTKDQLDAVYAKLVSAFGSGNFEFSIWESGNSTWQYTPYSQISADKTYSKYKFRLLKDYQGSNITLDYQSTINKSTVIYFTNTISSNGFTKTADYKYEETGKVFKMDGDKYAWDGQNYEYSLNDTEHEIERGGNLYWIVKVKLNDDTKTVTITDTPPAGLSLIGFRYGEKTSSLNSGDFAVSGGKIYWDNPHWAGGYGSDISVSGTIDSTGVVNVTFTAKNGKTLKEILNNTGMLYAGFFFETDLAPLDSPITKTYTNKASATLDGSPAGEDDHTQKITVKPAQKISKGGSWSNDNREVNYKLDINPYAEDLAAGKASYTVTDTLEYQEDLLTNLSYDLKQESVKLYDSNNQEVDKSQWSWTVEKTKDSSGLYKSVLKLTVPNKQKLRLEYSYTVSREVAADDKTDLSVKNTAEVSGFKTGETENTVSYTWQKMSTSGTAQTTKYFKLTKVDLDNFAIVLPNAVFEVRENGTDKVVATYKTAADGTLHITKDGKEATNTIEPLEDNKLYYVTEVQAPSGYKLPTNPERYYFYFSETGAAPLNLGNLTDLSSAVNLAKQSKSEYVTNKQLPPTTSITVDKKWQNADGSAAERTSGTVTVHLKRVSDIDSTPVDIETRTIAYNGGKWSTTFDNLPTSGDDEEHYSYFVEEDKVAGYEATYSNSAASSVNASDVTATSGTITITNKAQKEYNLPKTGGSGIERLMAAGIALAVTAAYVLGYQAFRKYQSGGQL